MNTPVAAPPIPLGERMLLVRPLSHYHELTLGRGLAMHAAARRADAHLLLEAESAAEKVKRRANVAVEEIENDLRRFGVIDMA